MKKTIISILASILISSYVVAGVEVAWEETFDSPAATLKRADLLFKPLGSKQDIDLKTSPIVVQEWQNGSFRQALKYDKTHMDDYFIISFGQSGFGNKPPLDIDLGKYPVIEFRWRGEYLMIYYVKQGPSGQPTQDYVYPTVDHKEKDKDGKEWNISYLRPTGTASSKGYKLLGFCSAVLGPREPKGYFVELDNIKVRSLTEEEKEKEEKLSLTFKDFPAGTNWAEMDKRYDNFFPYGLYGLGFLKGTFESWNGGYQGAYDLYSRNHINYILQNYEYEIGRLVGQSLNTDKWQTGVEQYLKQVQPVHQLAREYGIKRSGDMRSLMGSHNPLDGYKQLKPIAESIVKGLSDYDDVIYSWFLADEPGIEMLPQVVSIARAIREADPLKRPELAVFFATVKYEPYMPYLSLCLLDNYPIIEGKRYPWCIRDMIRSHRLLNPSKRIWITLQAFETRPPIRAGDFARPNDAEMRLMAYLSLAEGAKGIVWFHGWGGMGDHEHLVERTGMPRGGMLDTISDLGEKIIPIGSQLLATEPVYDTKAAVQQMGPDTPHKITVSVLKHQQLPINYLVVINEDIDNARLGVVSLDKDVLAEGQGVYDLNSLDGKNLLSNGKFNTAVLAGGDGRFYAVCDAETFKKLRSDILCAKVRESIRAMKPDIVLAERWRLHLGEVYDALDAATASLATSNPREALAKVSLAKTLLDKVLKSDSQLVSIRRSLLDIQIELTEMGKIAEYPVFDANFWYPGLKDRRMVPNPGFLELSSEYWQIGRSCNECFTDFYNGKKQGLWEKVQKTRAACGRLRVKLLALQREKLAPLQKTESKQ